MNALVLSGSGMRMPYHLGVAEILHKHVDFSHYYGVSGGGIMADLLSYCTMEELIDEFLKVDGVSDFWKLLAPWERGIYSSDRLKRYLAKMRKNRTAHSRGTVAIQDYYAGELIYLDTANTLRNEFGETLGIMNFRERAHATAAVPGLIEPVQDLQGKYRLGDGGISEMAPLKLPIIDGFNTIYVSFAYPIAHSPPPWEEKFPYKTNYLLRALEIILHRRLVKDVAKCNERNKLKGYRHIDLRIVSPRTGLPGDDFEFTDENWRASYERGKLDACEFVEKWKNEGLLSGKEGLMASKKKGGKGKGMKKGC